MQSLANKLALVSGASRGIGFAIAKELVHCGATVFGTSTTSEGVVKINEISATGSVLDVNDKNAATKLIQTIIEAHGKLDILVNNAGITRDQLTIRLSDEAWSEVINTNMNSVFFLSRLALPHMLRANYGRIINITSILASTGNIGQANYAAAKAGVEAMSKSMAKEVASKGITINCIAPGFIVTDMTASIPEKYLIKISAQIPMGRFGKPEDIAHAVSFLASENASYITGNVLHVNGGMYMN